MDGSFDIGFFIVVGILFFVLPFAVIIGIINLLISKRMAKKGQQKSKYYWVKLIGFSILVLVIGLFLHDGYYKLTV